MGELWQHTRESKSRGFSCQWAWGSFYCNKQGNCHSWAGRSKPGCSATAGSHSHRSPAGRRGPKFAADSEMLEGGNLYLGARHWRESSLWLECLIITFFRRDHSGNFPSFALLLPELVFWEDGAHLLLICWSKTSAKVGLSNRIQPQSKNCKHAFLRLSNSVATANLPLLLEASAGALLVSF